jgi:hypothetical protein
LIRDRRITFDRVNPKITNLTAFHDGGGALHPEILVECFHASFIGAASDQVPNFGVVFLKISGPLAFFHVNHRFSF